MNNDILLLLGSGAGAFLAIISALTLIFVTKDNFNKDCAECRKALYAEINLLKSNKLDKETFEKLSAKFENLSAKIDKMNETLIELMTTIKVRIKQEEDR